MGSCMIRKRVEPVGGVSGYICSQSKSNAVRVSMFNTSTMEDKSVWVDTKYGFDGFCASMQTVFGVLSA